MKGRERADVKEEEGDIEGVGGGRGGFKETTGSGEWSCGHRLKETKTLKSTSLKSKFRQNKTSQHKCEWNKNVMTI